MNKITYSALVCILLSSSLFSQQRKEIVATINGKPIYKEELVREFEQNQASVDLEHQESLRSFLDSYIDYRLNIEEAHNQNLDTTKAYLRELKSYEYQLKNDYLRDTLAAKNLGEAIFERFNREVEVNHIFVPFEGTILFPKDTLEYYQKALELTELAQKKGFDKVGDEWNKVNSFGVVLEEETQTGSLGWIRPFSFPLKLEEVLYKLPLHEVTVPIRTEKGYHVFQVVGHRPLQGNPVVEQLLFGFPVIPADKQMRDSVYNVAILTYDEISIRDNFSQICAEFSKVFQTGDRGCLLGEVDLRSQYPQSLIQEAFQLQNIGDISKPILTTYGYHILRLIDKKKVLSEGALKRMIRESLNSPTVLPTLLKVQKENLVNRIGAKVNSDALGRIFQLTESYNPNDSTFQDRLGNVDEVLLEIDGGAKTYTVQNFLNYRHQLAWMNEPEEDDDPLVMLKVKPMLRYTLSTDILQNQFDSFIYAALSKYERETLEAKNPDYANAIRRISEGILFAMLQEKEIWNKKNKEGLDVEFQDEMDYQQDLAKKWNAALRKKYDVVINDAVINEIK